MCAILLTAPVGVLSLPFWCRILRLLSVVKERGQLCLLFWAGQVCISDYV